MGVVIARQSPAASLWVRTVLWFWPNAGLSSPVNPAEIHAARASDTVSPTRPGTVPQTSDGVDVGVGSCAGVGVGSGAGVEAWVGVGVGDCAGLGVAIGLGVAVGIWGGGGVGMGVTRGRGVGVGVGDGVGVGMLATRTSAEGRAARLLGAAVTAAGAGAGAADASAVAPMRSVGNGCGERPWSCDACAPAPGVLNAPSTSPLGRKGPAIMSVNAETARTAPTTAIGAFLCLGCRIGARRSRSVAKPAEGAGTPHPGHAPAAPAQHRSHACTPHDGQR